MILIYLILFIFLGDSGFFQCFVISTESYGIFTGVWIIFPQRAVISFEFSLKFRLFLPLHGLYLHSQKKSDFWEESPLFSSEKIYKNFFRVKNTGCHMKSLLKIRNKMAKT